MSIRVFLRDGPQRAIALATDSHVLIFRHSPSTTGQQTKFGSSTSISESGTPRCIVEFSPWGEQDMNGYRTLSSLSIQGTLGLVTIDGDVFLCVVNGSSKVAEVRPGERVNRILAVEFHCLNSSQYDHLLHDQVNPFPTDQLDADGFDHGGHREPLLEHPCMALKKLLSGGTFYYSADFDLTKRVQDRPAEASTISIDSLDAGFLWNTYMIQPLVDFRSRLSSREKDALDASRILTSAIRGFAGTVPVPASSSPARRVYRGLPSNMTLISRLSCRRAGTRFNARGIDDDGNVANFSETETIFTTDQLCFSYVQCRGSVPLFWEQSSGLPGQQKIQVTRSVEATQPAFDKHMQRLSENYGDIVVVNLLSEEKPQELQLTRQYMHHIDSSTLNDHEKGAESEHKHIIPVNYDFHAETRGPNGYEAASGIRRWIESAALAFEYYLSEETTEIVHQDGRKHSVIGQNEVLKQAGVFRTNCLDCLDRTNLVQTIVSQIAFEIFLMQRGEQRPTSDFWARHGMLWADNGDALSKIYAGTGALKSSFTRSGKMSLAGTLADIRKSAQRFYINNVEDKGRQSTMDMLLGRLVGQMPVHLYDPINDWVVGELSRRAPEFTSPGKINIWAGTFNLNGKTHGIEEDLRPWLCPDVEDEFKVPEVVAVAFQEIVDLDVNQILSTDPVRRSMWETAVRDTLNANAQKHGSEDYVMLRGGQLVGASLSVFVKASVLPMIRNVEGAVKKTGLSGMAGNKGAVAIRMEFADTSICLVTAHLAAGFGNYDERNQDYRTISSGLRFQRNRSIDDHKTVIWFGDFNYRIGLDNDRARQLIKKRDLGQLYENDQLNLQMVHGKVFPHYSEQTPTFLPTYKFNIGTDEYDTSDKARIPAWCDRILTKGDNIRQLYYDSAPLRFSDHKPVWALFSCTVSVVDQVKKDRISNQLYGKRRAAVAGHTAGATTIDSDDESLYGYESIEEGLPPASSDKRKWWLDNSMPARSTVQPPSAGHAPNPARPSNPFTPTNEPDWVKVEKPGTTPPSRPASLYSVSGSFNKAVPQLGPPRGEVVPRKLPPPLRATQAKQQGAGPTNLERKSDEVAQTQLQQTNRKPAPPPKPTKPNLLRSGSEASSITSSVKSVPPPPEPRRANNTPSNTTRSVISPPPPIRANGDIEKRDPAPMPPPPRKPVVKTTSWGSDAVPIRRPTNTAEADEKAPALPARRPTAPIMDDNLGDGEELGGWVPLKPS
ncbi:Putative SAC domain, endonuclease/exonuclease/phosphatase [Septoria linicola]|uniref:phosphoinositide 5-phosphatase n=1 Tax=Septoria linicola TaxID=215465 RepID=A0A9Q9AY25_9PEZI|nr:putative SAC domain, endonuclease/exonuclease/phosphatase [Septoria linicola]USW58087.1 Putative SAC domain, endonuclease/exonuclease/phosphatase [Septoria linicola]